MRMCYVNLLLTLTLTDNQSRNKQLPEADQLAKPALLPKHKTTCKAKGKHLYTCYTADYTTDDQLLHY